MKLLISSVCLLPWCFQITPASFKHWWTDETKKFMTSVRLASTFHPIGLLSSWILFPAKTWIWIWRETVGHITSRTSFSPSSLHLLPSSTSTSFYLRVECMRGEKIAIFDWFPPPCLRRTSELKYVVSRWMGLPRDVASEREILLLINYYLIHRNHGK